MSPLAPPTWPDHPVDRETIRKNLAKLDHEIATARGTRAAFTLDLPLEWHRRMHEGCLHLPTAEYVGNYRGNPGLYIQSLPVLYGPFQGTSPSDVATELVALETRIQVVVARFDPIITAPKEATPSRINNLLQAIAPLYAEWIRIHPFADGNGRTARVLINWFMARYWQPLIFPKRPPDNKPDLIRVTGSALVGGDYRPLTAEFRRRLVKARAASAKR